MSEIRRHNESLRRIKAKWGDIKNCRRLVERHTKRNKELMTETEKEEQMAKKRRYYFYKLKYKRLDREMLSHFPDNVTSEHNRWVVAHYGFMWCANRR